MALTRRAFGTIRNEQAQVPANGRKALAPKDLKRTLNPIKGSPTSQAIPAKRKNIPRDNQENIQHAVKSLPKDEQKDISISAISKLTLKDVPKEIKKEAIKDEKVALEEFFYEDDIFEYLQNKEKEMATVKVIENHPDSRGRMRSILVDWMVDVQQNFEMFHETLYLAVKYVDHYLMKKAVEKDHLQLLGCTAMFVAAKFEERSYPAIDDFLYMCADMYTKDDMIRMEMDILGTLTFDVNFPLSYSFLRRYSRIAGTDFPTLTLARYILEGSLLDFSVIEEHDSKISAAALVLAYRMQKMPSCWSRSLERLTGYKEAELEGLIKSLNKHVANLSFHNKTKGRVSSSKKRIYGENVFAKYSDKIFHQVTQVPYLPL